MADRKAGGGKGLLRQRWGETIMRSGYRARGIASSFWVGIMKHADLCRLRPKMNESEFFPFSEDV